MEEYSKKSVTVYWTKEKGIHYLNSGEEISPIDLVRGIREGIYGGVDLGWGKGPENGPLSSPLLGKMQERQSKLERMIEETKK